MRTAVVLGGSVAGLLAARVLADHAEQVVVVEQDDVGPDGTYGGTELVRRGVPQGAQMHALLEAGRRGVEQLLPGFTDEVVAAGAARGHSARDLWPHLDGRRKVLVGDLPMVSATRPFLEGHIRRRVLAHERVRLRVAKAHGLSFTGERVDGVRLTDAGTGGKAGTGGEVLSADLVVDATGRSTRIGAWLAAAGWPEPPLQRIHVDLGYATALLRTAPDVAEGMTVAQSLVRRADGRVRLATAGRVEGGRWVVLLAGYAQDRPRRDFADFTARCLDDPAEVFGKLVAGAELLGEVAVYRHPDNRRRDFHRLSRFPAGLVCVGDAVASFNPVYGQGMSSAALHASCLATYLRSGAGADQPAWSYFRAVRRVVDEAWQGSVLNDLRLPHAEGPKPRGFRIASGLGELVLRGSVTDEKVGLRFLDMMHMLVPPSALMRPGLLLRSARAVRQQKRTPPRTPA